MRRNMHTITRVRLCRTIWTSEWSCVSAVTAVLNGLTVSRVRNRMCTGSWFWALGPATANARMPKCMAEETTRSPRVVDLYAADGSSWMQLVTLTPYDGASPCSVLYVNRTKSASAAFGRLSSRVFFNHNLTIDTPASARWWIAERPLDIEVSCGISGFQPVEEAAADQPAAGSPGCSVGCGWLCTRNKSCKYPLTTLWHGEYRPPFNKPGPRCLASRCWLIKG